MKDQTKTILAHIGLYLFITVASIVLLKYGAMKPDSKGNLLSLVILSFTPILNAGLVGLMIAGHLALGVMWLISNLTNWIW